MQSTRDHGILYLIGGDRVGLLQDASAFVAERGCTVSEGISHTLSTEACVLLYITGSFKQLEQMEKDAPRLGEELGLLSLFTRVKGIDAARDRESLPLTLRVSSPDFVGLLSSLTDFFDKHGLHIVAHHVHKAAVPLSQGLATYRHRFTVLLPPEFNRKAFLCELDDLAAQVNFIRDDISHTDFY